MQESPNQQSPVLYNNNEAETSLPRDGTSNNNNQ